MLQTNQRKTSAVLSLYKECRPTVTMNSSAGDEHLPFWFCSLVNHLVPSYPLVSLSVCSSFQFVLELVFVPALFVDLFIAVPSVLTHQSVINPCGKLLFNVNTSALRSPLFSPFPFAARSPGEQE